MSVDFVFVFFFHFLGEEVGRRPAGAEAPPPSLLSTLPTTTPFIHKNANLEPRGGWSSRGVAHRGGGRQGKGRHQKREGGPEEGSPWKEAQHSAHFPSPTVPFFLPSLAVFFWNLGGV